MWLTYSNLLRVGAATNLTVGEARAGKRVQENGRAISAFLWWSTKLPKHIAQPHSTLVALEKLDKLEKNCTSFQGTEELHQTNTWTMMCLQASNDWQLFESIWQKSLTELRRNNKENKDHQEKNDQEDEFQNSSKNELCYFYCQNNLLI